MACFRVAPFVMSPTIQPILSHRNNPTLFFFKFPSCVWGHARARAQANGVAIGVVQAAAATLPSLVAAAAYTTASAPLDLVRSRVMAAQRRGSGGGGLGTGSSPGLVGPPASTSSAGSALHWKAPDVGAWWEVAAAVVRTEGVGALWRGWGSAPRASYLLFFSSFPSFRNFVSSLGWESTRLFWSLLGLWPTC
jgi:hypothetical protein